MQLPLVISSFSAYLLEYNIDSILRLLIAISCINDSIHKSLSFSLKRRIWQVSKSFYIIKSNLKPQVFF